MNILLTYPYYWIDDFLSVCRKHLLGDGNVVAALRPTSFQVTFHNYFF